MRWASAVARRRLDELGERAGCKRLSGLNPHNLSWLDAVDGRQCCGNKWEQVLKGIAYRAQDDNAQAPFRNVLLKLEILIASQEDGKPARLGLREQCAILETCPPLLLDGANVLTN